MSYIILVCDGYIMPLRGCLSLCYISYYFIAMVSIKITFSYMNFRHFVSTWGKGLFVFIYTLSLTHTYIHILVAHLVSNSPMPHKTKVINMGFHLRGKINLLVLMYTKFSLLLAKLIFRPDYLAQLFGFWAEPVIQNMQVGWLYEAQSFAHSPPPWLHWVIHGAYCEGHPAVKSLKGGLIL